MSEYHNLTSLIHLSITTKEFGEKGMNYLLKRIDYFSNLQTLSLSGNSLGGMCVRLLARNFNKIPHVKCLKLDGIY